MEQCRPHVVDEELEVLVDFKALLELKKQVVIGLFSDDELMHEFVLKGGSAIDLAYGYATGRQSLDVDLSMPGDFAAERLTQVEASLKVGLTRYLREKGYVLFDFRFTKKPSNPSGPVPDCWGGYGIEFKLATPENYARFEAEPEALARNALAVGAKGSTRFKVDLSKREYCEPKQVFELEGHVIYVYSPLMIVAEKLRALCQKMPEYQYSRAYRGGTDGRRARDFYDITLIMKHEPAISWGDDGCRSLLRQVFRAKHVDLALLGRIPSETVRAFHEEDFRLVRDTVPVGSEVHDFGHYFDFVADMVAKLEAFWEMETPLE